MRKRDKRFWLDTVALIAVLHYCAFRFLQNSKFPFEYSDRYKWIMILSMAGIGGLRFLFIMLPRWKEDPKRIWKTAACACCAVPFFLVAFKHDYKILIFIPLGVLCLYEMEYEKVLRGFVFTIGILLAAMVLCCLGGCITNYGYWWLSTYSYGALNTTDFASYFSFLLLYIWCIQKNRTWYSGAWMAAVSVVITITLYVLTKSRTAMICCILTVIAILWESLYEKKLKESRRSVVLSKTVDGMTVAAFPVIGLLSAVLIFFYGKGASWAAKLNEVFSGRIHLSWTIFQRHGIKLLGNTTLWQNDQAYYDFMDISYEMLAVRYGILITVIVTCFWTWMVIRAVRSGNRRMALAMMIIAIHSFSESHFMDLNYNIFLFMPFACLSGERKAKETLPQWAVSKAVTIGLACAAVLLLPRFLSWVRTVFYLQGWTLDENVKWALIAGIIFILACVLLWKSLSLIPFRRKAVFPLLLSVILIASGLFWMNQRIDRGLAENRDRLDREEEAIMAIQETAGNPVYAAELSELYQRRFGGFSDFASPEMATLENKGTLIFSNDSKNFLVWQNRQISESDQIITYDPAVKELSFGE